MALAIRRSTETSLQCLTAINMVFSDEDKIFIFEGYTAKRLTDEFPEKIWTKRDVNKLFVEKVAGYRHS